MSAITTIIVDFGGVLIQWDPRFLYRRLFSSETEMERFLGEIHFTEWNVLQDSGRPFAAGVAELSTQFPQYAHLIQAYHEHWEDSIGDPIQGTIEIIQKLKAKNYYVYGLSNWSSETFPIIKARYHFFGLLDGYMISGDAKVVKPDPAIFHMMLRRIGRSARECLFIDDSPKNISAATSLGFTCIKFMSPPSLEVQLIQLGVL